MITVEPESVTLFEFEKSDRELIFIPLIVRYKLDLVGIKLHLKQWRKLSRVHKENLISHDCKGENLNHYKDWVVKLVHQLGEKPTFLTHLDKFTFNPFPKDLLEKTKMFQLDIERFWHRLTEFEKYVLVRLFSKSNKKKKEIENIIQTFQLTE